MSHRIPPTTDEADNLLPLEVARVLENVRAEIQAEVAYALKLAAADTTERLNRPGTNP